VATYAKCGEIPSNQFTANLLQIFPVKDVLKSDSILKN